jgi:hypothetical protein
MSSDIFSGNCKANIVQSLPGYMRYAVQTVGCADKILSMKILAILRWPGGTILTSTHGRPSHL